MASIRDEVGKLLDIRIPPNGYRRYIKEIGRTGGFQDAQRDDCIIVLCQAVEDLQREVDELRQHPTINPFAEEPMATPASSVFGHLESPTTDDAKPEFECVTCGISFKQRIALEGHKRSKGHKDAVTKSA